MVGLISGGDETAYREERLHFLRLLRKCDVDVHLLRSFYPSTIESVLTHRLTIWYPGCTAKDREALSLNQHSKLLAAL